MRPCAALVVSRIGPRSLHGRWLGTSATRRFDVLLSGYGGESGLPAADPAGGLFVEHRPGTKVAGLDAVLDAHAGLIARYAHVALIDDDIDTDVWALNRLFEVARDGGYRICQPALSHDSHYSYAALLRQRRFARREVTFVEMMCPVFRQDALRRARPLFGLGYESGIDLVWCNLDSPGPTDFAIVDEVEVRHTRAVGSESAANGLVDGYDDTIAAVLEAFELPWLPCVPYAGVTRDGRRVRSRLALLCAALPTLIAAARVGRRRTRLHGALVHLKHVLLARPCNLDVTARLERIATARLPAARRR